MELDVATYVDGVRRGDRAILGRALTLVESDQPAHFAIAGDLLTALLPHAGAALRVGITGASGSGKSTLIETLGLRLTGSGARVAVLAVDPTSGLSGGSILGDKTRMGELAQDARAFIRPSPSRGALGGVAHKTRESIIVCEAAGYEVVLVETVGVGQSEVEVADMVDCFVVLMLPNAGDELQGIKRGIVEHADLIAINKADGALEAAAMHAKQQYSMALTFLAPREPCWKPEVHAVSARTGLGIDRLWERVGAHRDALQGAGRFAELRSDQAVRWMWRTVEDEVRRRVRDGHDVAALSAALEAEVRRGQTPPTVAAARLLELLLP